MRSNVMYTIFDCEDAQKRIKSKTQSDFVKGIFGNIDPLKCLQDDMCLDKVMESKLVSKIGQNAIETYLGGDHWDEEGYTSRSDAVLHRAFFPERGYVNIGLLEHDEDSMLLFKCFLPSYFRPSLNVLDSVHSKSSSLANKIPAEVNPYAKFEERFAKTCREEDALYANISAIHSILVSKVKADPSLCRKVPDDTKCKVGSHI